MKKTLVLCGGLMLLASTALAQWQGLHMKWNGCPNHPAATSTEDFTCDGGIHQLHGTFSLTTTVPGVHAMDAIIDLLFQSPDVPAFWQFQGGCNEAGLVSSDARPTTNCTAAANFNTLCGAGGQGCDGFITSYAYGAAIGFPSNHARLMYTVARGSPSPVTLTANSQTGATFAFQFSFSEANASEIGGPCDGCLTGVVITWNQAVFYDYNARNGGEAIAAVLSSTDPGSVDATAFSNCPGCLAVSTKVRRWGQLKSLYR